MSEQAVPAVVIPNRKLTALERASNALLGLVWQLAFRPGFSARAMRRNFVWITTLLHGLSPKPRGLTVEPARLGGVPAEILTPAGAEAPTRTILYLHGGGYFMGSPYCYRHDIALLAHRAQARVALIDYRLAPEHPHPAALDDALAAYEALLETHAPETLAIAGDSAGGGLALATLLALRDRGRPLPARALCLSPWTDMLGTGDSMRVNEGHDVWLSRRHIAAWASWYFGDKDPRNAYLSPVHGDYRGLPPLLIMVGDQEVLLDDAVRVARKAAEAEVRVKLVVGEGMQHDWMYALPWLGKSQSAWSEMTAFLRGC